MYVFLSLLSSVTVASFARSRLTVYTSHNGMSSGNSTSGGSLKSTDLIDKERASSYLYICSVDMMYLRL